ncbi:MAG: hypothetical protein Unbinned3338contig1000_46 [Prokaryotic dsDNA virus sp.]|nr:MAG: hypothetical protein Unbinned3338contig1000_46 [Prokaryotic dsDNA virus sp.]|tara:strand:+ start:10905 stop:11120 length:216 start_codon:yes stop_codon:yes gene_type:complete
MATKKITIKEAEKRINILAYNLNVAKAAIDNIGLAFSQYLKYKGDEEEFKKYLENKSKVDKLKESVENDAK